MNNTNLQLKRNMLHFNPTAIAVGAKIPMDFGGIGIAQLRQHRLLAVSRQHS